MNGMNGIGIAKGSTLRHQSSESELRFHPTLRHQIATESHAEASEAAATSLGIESLNYETGLVLVSRHDIPLIDVNISIPKATVVRGSEIYWKTMKKTELSERFKTFVSKPFMVKNKKNLSVKALTPWLSAAPADAVASRLKL